MKFVFLILCCIFLVPAAHARTGMELIGPGGILQMASGSIHMHLLPQVRPYQWVHDYW